MNQTWNEVAAVPTQDLVAATLELHWAVQILASVGQTFSEARPDDSHRALSWDASGRFFVGAPFSGPYPFRVALRPEDLTLILLDRTGEALGSLPLSDVTLNDGYAWLRTGLATYMGSAPPEIQRPEYEMPAHEVADGARFATGRAAERRALSALFGGAAAILEELVSTRDDASPVLCWPHHFDIATLLTLDARAGEEQTRTVGVGMAPTGGGYDSWYWYVTPYPYPDASNLPQLDGPGRWRTEGWTGVVLTGEELAEADPAFRDAVLRKYVDVSVRAAVRALTP